MNSYEQVLKSQYSCWGHFDGLNIEVVQEKSQEEVAGEGQSQQAPVSELWAAIQKKQEYLYGGYSNQNIGIFRCISGTGERQDIGTAFWREAESMPFCAVGVLQLKNPLEYDEVSEKIEKAYYSPEINCCESRKCNVLAYATYENADLVVLLYSNSLRLMEKRLQEVEAIPEVEYLYSVIGVAEKYLDECRKENEFFEQWNNTKCFINEPLGRITLELVAKGKSAVNGVKTLLMDIQQQTKGRVIGCENVLYSHTIGHTSAVMTIKETDVKTLLYLTVPNGIITHQNELYGNAIYNIETSFVTEEESIDCKDELEEKLPGETESIAWCEKLIREYKKKLSNAEERDDEGFCAHYRAIIQTLNTLAQYEQFELARDIFYLLFPAFNIFNHLLEDAEKRYTDKLYGTEEIKKTIRHFIDSVNSVMYHTISNGQTFFMIPGYSGISFSVPIKLTLMYLWVVDKVATILNDCNYEYECILVPEMESRPVTKLMDFGLNNNNRLICVHMAQRALFFPRNFMIILGHEIAHYIGKGLRNRKMRANCVVHTLVYALAEIVLPEGLYEHNVPGKYGRAFAKTCERLKENIQEEIFRVLEKSIKDSNIDSEYYSKDLERVLIDASKQYLIYLSGVLEKKLHDAYEEIIFSVESDTECFKEKMQEIYTIYDSAVNNIQQYLASNSIDKIVKKIIRVYRETFSDIAAIVILDCTEQDFEETFCVSEGVQEEGQQKSDQQILREKIVCYIQQEQFENQGIKVQRSTTKNKIYYGSNLADVIYDFIWMQQWLEMYAIYCYESLKTRIESEEVREDVNAIRKCFQLFTGDTQSSCFGVYQNVMNQINEYTLKVHRKYKESLCGGEIEQETR